MSAHSRCNDGAVITNDEDLRIVMVGKTGSGKSASGNTILGFRAFESRFSLESQTKSCKKARSVVAGRNVSVVDTPGLFDTKFSKDEISREIKQCFCLSAPGPHVFLVVIKLGRFTEEEQGTVEMIQKTFGQKSNDYTMILFTHGDQLEDEPVETLLNNSPELLKLISKCNGRYHVFNNKTKDPSQVTDLLEKINVALSMNGGSHYTNEMFQEAEKAIKEEKDRILRENEEKIREAEEELRKRFEEETQEKANKMIEEQQQSARKNEEKIHKDMEEMKKKYENENKALKQTHGMMIEEQQARNQAETENGFMQIVIRIYNCITQ